MRTPKQAKADRRALLRDVDQADKQKQRAALAKLRKDLDVARARRDEALQAALARCRQGREAARERVRALRETTLAELRAKGAAERGAARSSCALGKDDARATQKPALDRVQAELEAERAHQAELRRLELANRRRAKAKPKATRAERAAESDDAVRANLEPEFVPLFEKVKRQIKGSARESRTEAFLRYAEEHPGELLAVLDEVADRLVRELEDKEREAAKRYAAAPKVAPKKTTPKTAAPRAAARATSSARGPRYTPEQLAEVPF